MSGSPKHSPLESSQSAGFPSADDDTFETRARTSALGPRPSAAANQRPLSRATTFVPGQDQLGHARTSSTDEVMKMYKQGYARPHMRHVTFISRFRKQANELHSQPSRLDSSIAVPMDGSDDDTSPLLTFRHNHTASAASFSQHAPQITHGAMYSSIIDSQAKKLKQAEAMSNNLAYGRLVFEILLTTLVVLAAIAVAYRDEKLAPKKHACDVPWRSTTFLADTCSSAMPHYPPGLVASALLLQSLVLIIMRERNFDLHDNHLNRINSTSLCFVVFVLVDLVKTLGCRLPSLFVNAESLFDLLKDTIEKERILNTIMTKSGQDHEQTEKERFEAISKLRSIPDWSVGQYLSNFYVLSLPVDSSVVASFTDRITELVAQFRTMTEPQLEEHATCAAEYFWLTVRNDLSKDTMEKEDVVELLSGKDEANVAFGLFDLNSDGYVTEPEVHSRFQYMYRQNGNLARTLRDNDDVISTLEMLTGILMHTIALVAYAAIFGSDVGHLLISLSSISVAFAFVFGNSLKIIYECVLFLFVIRPYQVGDAIVNKGALNVVKNFGLLSTQCLRFDGCRVWVRCCFLLQVPNQSLMTSDIVNVTQSRNLVDRLTFEVDVLEMKPELCEELAGRVLDMMNKEEPRRLSSTDFVPSSYIVGVTNPLKYTVGLTYQLAFNGERFARVAEARTLVNHVIGQWLQAHKLTHSTSIQPLYTYDGAQKLAN